MPSVINNKIPHIGGASDLREGIRMSFNKIEQKLKEFTIDTETESNINTNEQLKEIERNIGNQLPSDYKDF